MSIRKVVFIVTHPIQYFSPLFKYINEKKNLECEVWYLSSHGLNSEVDRQFATKIKWDIPLLEGYLYSFLKNYSLNPGIYSGFFGLINFGLFSKLRTLPEKSIVVVQGWNTFSHVYSIILAKLLGHTVCIRGESSLRHELRKSQWSLFLRKLILSYGLFKFIDKFLYIGKQNKAFYEFYGAKKENLIFTPYSVNNENFDKQSVLNTPNKNKIKAELRIPEHSKVILYSGKLIEKKNPMDLLDSFSLLPPEMNCFLVFVGDGHLRTEIEAAIRKKGIKHIMITGFINQSEISKYYSIADLFVMCSGHGETWGLSTNEAMNFAVPILISDLTGNADDLVDGNGLIFETNNVKDLANKMTILLQKTPNELTAMGKRSKELIRKYSFSQIEEGLQLI